MQSNPMAREGEFILTLAHHAGIKLAEGACILDFGCGSGDLVRFFVEKGFNAYGVDLVEHWEHGNTRNRNPTWSRQNRQRFRKIEESPYYIPFEDNFFDFCCSTQVFEHVQAYPPILRELDRVLNRGGSGLHIFPARWRFIEPHFFAPLGGAIQWRWYLALWAFLGVRNQYQKGMTWREVAEANCNYLKNRTNYMSQRQITLIVADCVGDGRFLSKDYLRYHPSKIGRFLGRLPIPGLASLVSKMSQRVLMHSKRRAE